MNRYKAFALMAALGLLLSLALACGKKDWPKPQKREDRFFFQNATARREGACLLVAARVDGAVERLQSVALRLEVSDTPCPDCIFNPQKRVDFPLTDERVELVDRDLRLNYCELEADKSYRAQLVGVSDLPHMPLVQSGVLP